MRIPQVGESVVVRHVSRVNQAGDARLVQDDTTASFVKTVYPLNRIKTTAGDVFHVRPNAHKDKKYFGCQWMTTR